MKIKTTRNMTICSCSENKGSYVMIKGLWLRKCGFNPGDRIEIINNKNGILTITNKGNKFTKWTCFFCFIA